LINETPRQLLERYWPEVAATVVGLLVVVLAVHDVRLVRAQAQPTLVQPIQITPVDGPLARVPWFGAPNTQTAPPIAAVALVLVGTLATGHPTHGYALIGPDANTIKTYAVNDALPGGAVLSEVYADHVLLTRNGVREILNLPKQLAPGTPVPTTATPAAPTFGATIQKLQNQPNLIAEIIKPLPQFENGHLKGFKVFAGADAARFERSGLKAGDVITQVNAVPITDGTSGLELIKSLGNSQSAQVTVERDGRLLPITIEASVLSSHHSTP